MLIIQGGRGCGKTQKLIEEVKKTGGIIVTAKSDNAIEQKHIQGADNVEIRSYYDLTHSLIGAKQPIYIDDIEEYLRYLNCCVGGFTVNEQ